MAADGIGVFIRRLRATFSPAEAGGLSDRELLDRWVERRDEAAFETLVWRHGPLVLSVCRRLLHDAGDVEDAFQATFVALLCKASAVRRESIGGWLYRVAYRVALRARASSTRRASRERPTVCDPPSLPADRHWGDLQPVLDEEVDRLAERERVPFVLCYLQGRTNEEAARELGCPVGTVESRLARARRQLRARLARRGLAPAAVALAGGIAVPDVAGSMPGWLVVAVIETGRTAGAPERIASLANAALRGIFTPKLNAAAALFALGLVGAGTAFAVSAFAVSQEQRADSQAVARSAPLPPEKEKPSATPLIASTKLLDQAAEAIDDTDRNALAVSRILERLGVLRARSGDAKGAGEAFDRAQSVVLRLDANGQQFEWRELAKAQAEAGEIDTGLETAKRVTGGLKHATVQEMASLLARAGNFKEALRLADKVEDAEQRDIALVDVARARADAGDVKAALQIADSIKGPFARVLALAGSEYSEMGGIALVQAKAGDRSGARETLNRAVMLAETIKSGPGAGRVWAWLARAEARLGDFATARKWADRAPTEEKLPHVGLTRPRDLAFQEIAIAEAEAGRIDDAVKTVNAHLASSGQIAALNSIAVARARAGQRKACRAVFKEATKLAEEVADNQETPRSYFYNTIATAQAEAGEFDAAEKTAALLGDSGAIAYGNIADQRARAGDFNKALESVKRIGKDEFWRTRLLQAIARMQTEAGDERAALARITDETTPADKAVTLLGVVEGRINREKRPKK
jgi:RNA polymerase sigma factor (sigma-70 family)